jgi:hypothetical protein
MVLCKSAHQIRHLKCGAMNDISLEQSDASRQGPMEKEKKKESTHKIINSQKTYHRTKLRQPSRCFAVQLKGQNHRNKCNNNQ